MTICYEVDGSLYLNITNRCSNRCEFCIRNNGDGAYGSDPLWLEREPDRDEILKAVFSRDIGKYREIVFCGYGEPTYRLADAVTVAKEIKKVYPDIPIRINTNGQSDLILGGDSSKMFENAFDTVSISLNTPSADKYVEICRPVYKEAAYSAIIEFAKNVNKYVHSVVFSVVRQTLTEEELSECEKIAKEAGVILKIRDYISE
ncbi:MAG: radical SAM protein [Ruminococcaceae bacterium]|nr:radical SAM protein [Oscillospiraceae bacterium]